MILEPSPLPGLFQPCEGSLGGLSTQKAVLTLRRSKSSANLRKLLGGSGEELGQGSWMFKVTLPLALHLGKCPSPRFLQELLHLSPTGDRLPQCDPSWTDTITGIGRARKERSSHTFSWLTSCAPRLLGAAEMGI